MSLEREKKVIERLEVYAIEICTNRHSYDEFDELEASKEALEDIMKILGVSIDCKGAED